MQQRIVRVCRSAKVMVLNLGSTSFKFKLYDADLSEVPYDENVSQVLAEGCFESVGAEGRFCLRYVSTQNRTCQTEEGCISVRDHRDGFERSMRFLLNHEILSSFEEMAAILYKAVHAGELSGVSQINEEILDIMERYMKFAPVHNRVYLELMRNLRDSYPHIIQIGVFETAFHATIPEKRRLYGVPYEWREDLGIYRYGFHGASHSYIGWRMEKEMPEAKRIISMHLGGSSSLCAIESGKSIASTMGATPQSGLFQNNRVGDLDVFCLPALMNCYGNDVDQILKILSSQSGLQGVSGVSNDFRKILEYTKSGESPQLRRRAALASEALVDQIIGFTGMFIAYLKGVDAIAFTGGIGRNSAWIRKRVCEEMKYLNVILDEIFKTIV